MIQMTCPGCGKTLRILDKFLGENGKCRSCLTRIEVTVPPGIRMEDPHLPTLQMVPVDPSHDSEEELGNDLVYCPNCHDTIILLFPYEGMEMVCNRCGASWTLEKLAREVEDEIEFTSPAIRETWVHMRMRIPGTL